MYEIIKWLLIFISQKEDFSIFLMFYILHFTGTLFKTYYKYLNSFIKRDLDFYQLYRISGNEMLILQR